ncbi:MAG: DUF494 domain-containing protein [candidate division Zixibacteria bacterium]|nr:DUF494 domain-containing protein [candidate division Zixibacteria bacterium]
MRNRVLEIVVVLIDFMQGDGATLVNSEEVSTALEAEGYSEDEIASAYSWLLHRFDNAPEQFFSQFPTASSSIRVLTQAERTQLSPEAYGYLLKLVHLSLIDAEQLEMLLERVSVFGPRAVDLEQLKLIASSVVFDELSDLDLFDMTDGTPSQSARVN